MHAGFKRAREIARAPAILGSMHFRLPGRRARAIVLVVAGVLVTLATAGYIVLKSTTRDVDRGGEVEFAQPGARPHTRSARGDRPFKWPFYGYTRARTRYLAADIDPPFLAQWRFKPDVLLEFSPVLGDGILYQIDNQSRIYAIKASTGVLQWTRRLGTLNASSPAYRHKRLFVVTLTNEVAALDAKTGKVIWSRKIPTRSESSPVVENGVVYFGTEGGTLYAVDAETGKTRWTYSAHSAIKAAPALRLGVLYVADYGGRVYAIRANTGKAIWVRTTSGAAFGLGSGRFYSTPAVAWGRVYLGNTDGKVYSFSARTGEIAWTHSTGGYVYAAPAVADVPGTPPTVYIGSYDNRFYALDARTGAVRWIHEAGGRISGAATVIGDIVYYANLGKRRTTGLDVRTGKQVFDFVSGGFNPVISDGRWIYLTGFQAIWALKPKPPDWTPTKPKHKPRQERTRHKRR